MTDREDVDRLLSKMGYSHPEQEIAKNTTFSPYMTYQEQGKEIYTNNNYNTYAIVDESKLQPGKVYQEKKKN